MEVIACVINKVKFVASCYGVTIVGWVITFGVGVFLARIKCTLKTVVTITDKVHVYIDRASVLVNAVIGVNDGVVVKIYYRSGGFDTNCRVKVSRISLILPPV